MLALKSLNRPLSREGYEAAYGKDNMLYIRYIGTKTVSTAANPHRPFTPDELKRRPIVGSNEAAVTKGRSRNVW